MAGVSDNLREFGSWSEQTSSSGRKYYYNSESEVSQWDKPKEWKDHELRLEAERQAAEQHRMQFQPVPPPPPPPFFQNFPFNGGNIPPQPNYQGYQGGRMGILGAAPPVSHYSNSFMPPNSIPPVPPPPRNPLPRHPDIGGSIYPTPQYRNYFPPPMPPAPKYNTAPAGAPVQRGPSSSSVNRNYGRPSPSTAQGQQSRYPAHDGRAPSQVGPHSRDEQGKPHPYATPQPIMNQSYQTTPKRPTRDSRDGYDSERPKQQQQYKREYEAGSSTDESPASKRPAMQQQQSQDDDRMDISIGKEEEEEEQGQTGKEEWRPYYRPDLSQKKAAELGLEDDTELGDIQMQCIVLENKWQNMEIQAKQAAAVRMVVEQEVAMTNMRIESCRQQQREIEAKSMHQVPLSGDKRREYLENLQRRLRSMKLEPRVSS